MGKKNNSHTSSYNRDKRFFGLPKRLTVLALLVLLVVGLVSTTFSSIVSDHTEDNGSILVDIKNRIVPKSNKSDLADTKANVDMAETGAQYNINWQGHVYFLAPEKWDIETYNCIQVDITRTTSASETDGNNNYQYYAGTMTRVGSSRLFYLDINANHTNWNQNEYIAFTANSYAYGSGHFKLNENHYYTTPLNYGCNNDSNYYLFKPSTTASNSTTLNGNSMAGSYSSSQDLVKAEQMVNITCDDVASSACGKVDMTGYYFDNSKTTISQSIASSTSSSVKYSGAVIGSSMELQATANTGYKFVGWYDGTTLISSNTTYSYNVFSAKTLTAKFEVDGYSYTVSAGEGGKITSATSGTATSATITAQANNGYKFKEWTATGGSVVDSKAASTTFNITDNGAKATASFEKIPYTITYHANGGNINESYDTGYTIGSAITLPINVTKTGYTFIGWYANSNLSGSKITQITSTEYGNKNYYAKYEPITYTITYNDNGGTFTGSRPSSYTIETQTITLPTESYMTKLGYVFSGWYDNEACTGNAILTIPKGSTGNKTLFAKWNETNYDLTITNSGTVNGDVIVSVNGTEATSSNGIYKIPHGSLVNVTVERPDTDCFFSNVKVDDVVKATNSRTKFTTSFSNFVNSHSIDYTLIKKPLVQFTYPEISGVTYTSATLEYTNEGSATSVNVDTLNPSSIYVDYNSGVKYTLNLGSGATRYISGFSGVTIDVSSITANGASGSKASVTSDLTITPTFTECKSFTLKFDATGDLKTNDGLEYKLDNESVKLDVPKMLPYNTETSVTVIPPEGYYARVYNANSPLAENDVTYDKGAPSFNVTVTDTDVVYAVKYFKNPTVSVSQPLYGSIYVTTLIDGEIKYLFNDDTVYGGSDVTVNVICNNSNATLNGVYANDVINIGNDIKISYQMFENTTFSAGISMNDNYSFEEVDENNNVYVNTVAYGKRRIFLTDNHGWGDGNVVCHYADTDSDSNYEKNFVVMTYQFTNNIHSGQRVYYADIPFDKEYVIFYKKGDINSRTNYVQVDPTHNAYYIEGSTLIPWSHGYIYSDYFATDRIETAQQAKTAVDVPVSFYYTCDFSDDSLTYELVSGDNVECTFSNGELIVTPKSNTNGCSLIKVVSRATQSEKYYLIGVSKLAGEIDAIQKIYELGQVITLSGKFEGQVIKTIQYNISETNFPTGYALMEEVVASGVSLSSFSFNVEESDCKGVKFFKITAVDENGYNASTTSKVVFGTDKVNSNRLVYLYNDTTFNMSNCCVRACFESVDGAQSWVTMQKLEGSDYYRASIPQGYSYKVSFYLTHKQRYANIKSDHKDYTLICYYGAENIVFPIDTSFNPVYCIKEFFSNRTMKLELLK